MQDMSQSARAAAAAAADTDGDAKDTPETPPQNPFNAATLWPWNLVPQANAAAEPPSAPAAKPSRSRKPRKTGADE